MRFRIPVIAPPGPCAGFALAGLLLATPGLAAVTCTVSATPLDFGIYSPLNAAATVATGTVTTTCTLIGNSAERVTVSSSLSYSTGSSGTFASRTMRFGSDVLNYNLYSSSTYTQIWGDGTAGTQRGNASFMVNNGHRTQSVSNTIYGRMPALQDVMPGSYSDTITVTITY